MNLFSYGIVSRKCMKVYKWNKMNINEGSEIPNEFALHTVGTGY